MSSSRAQYTLSLKDTDRLYTLGQANAANSKNVYAVKWNDLPPAEKFVLRLETFGADTRKDVTGITSTCYTTTEVSLDAAGNIVEIGTNVTPDEVTGTAYVYLEGLSSNSGWALNRSNNGNGVQQRILLTRLDTSFVTSGNIVQPPHVPSYVIDRPSQNGNITISIEALDGSSCGVLPNATTTGDTHVFPNHMLQISLTPMTSKEIAEYDCRA
tara:strand:- start:1667 stop:2305 length:639 start_codon:yes stop_codon:yes gene_type:complete